MPARPEIGFVETAKPGAAGQGGSVSGARMGGAPLPIRLEIPSTRFMHPGPVMVPVVIAPGAEVTSKLRWVSGEVFDSNLCFNPTAITVTIGGETQRASLVTHICGDKGKGVTFQATPLAPDPHQGN